MKTQIPQKNGTGPPPNFRLMSIATKRLDWWYGSRRRSRPHSSLCERGSAAPHSAFRPMSIVARSPIYMYQLLLNSCTNSSPKSVCVPLCHIKSSAGRNIPPIFTKLAIIVVSQAQEMIVVSQKDLRPSNRKWN